MRRRRAERLHPDFTYNICRLRRRPSLAGQSFVGGVLSQIDGVRSEEGDNSTAVTKPQNCHPGWLALVSRRLDAWTRFYLVAGSRFADELIDRSDRCSSATKHLLASEARRAGFQAAGELLFSTT